MTTEKECANKFACEVIPVNNAEVRKMRWRMEMHNSESEQVLKKQQMK